MRQGAVSVAAIVLAGLMLAGIAAHAELPTGDPERGRQVFQPCRTCHYPESGFGNYNGPSLTGIFGRKAGTREGFNGLLEGAQGFGFRVDARTARCLACESGRVSRRLHHDLRRDSRPPGPGGSDRLPAAVRLGNKAIQPVGSPTDLLRSLRNIRAACRHILRFLPREEQPGLDDRVRIQRHALDALLDQPAREVRMIRRPLAADADVLARLAAGRDRHREQRLDRVVALVEQRAR